MIFKECWDWVKALEECVPRAKTRRLRNTLTRLSRKQAGGRWEISLEAAPRLARVGVRYSGGEGGFRAFRGEAAFLSEGAAMENTTAPPAGFPWLEFRWSLRKDELEAACLYSGAAPTPVQPGQAAGFESGGKRYVLHPTPFSEEVLRDADLGAVFGDIASLFPVRDIVTRWEIDPASGRRQACPRWALRFQEGVSWPTFICSNLADPFLSQSSRLAYLLLNRRVAELSFEGKTLWAHLGA